MVGPDQTSKRKRIRVIESSEESSTSDSDLDSDPADDDADTGTGPKSPPFKIPKIEKARWSDAELSQLKKHFSSLAHLDDAIVKKLTFKEMAANKGRKDRSRKALTKNWPPTMKMSAVFQCRSKPGLTSALASPMQPGSCVATWVIHRICGCRAGPPGASTASTRSRTTKP